MAEAAERPKELRDQDWLLKGSQSKRLTPVSVLLA